MDIGLALLTAALPSFAASAVEFVEALTIILAVGVTRLAGAADRDARGGADARRRDRDARGRDRHPRAEERRDHVIGLFFEDGQLAIGIVLALALAWLIGTVNEIWLDEAAWLLLALLIALLLANLVLTARRAKRRIA